MPLTSATTMANSAGSRHPPRRSATMVRPSMNGRPAHGSRMTEMRPGVLQEVGREHVGQGGRRRSRSAQAEDARQVQHPEPGAQEDGAEPQPLGHPHRHAEQVEDGEERPHRQQVADVLVRHRAQAHRRVPHEGDLLQEAQRVEVEVRLGVRRDHAGSHGQQRHVGHDGHHGPPADPPPATARRTDRPWGRVPPPGGGDCGGGGHEGGPKGRRVMYAANGTPECHTKGERPW